MATLTANNLFKLEFPQSVGVFNTYEEAQKVVDFLAEQRFPVENLCIVGTELKSMERVLGRRNWGTVLMNGVQSGITTGLMVTVLMWVFMPGSNILTLLLTAMAIGIGIGMVMSALSYWMSQGKRDFNSVSRTVATKYEILCEHRVVTQARDLIMKIPGIRAAVFNAPVPLINVPIATGVPNGPVPGGPSGPVPGGFPAPGTAPAPGDVQFLGGVPGSGAQAPGMAQFPGSGPVPGGVADPGGVPAPDGVPGPIPGMTFPPMSASGPGFAPAPPPLSGMAPAPGSAPFSGTAPVPYPYPAAPGAATPANPFAYPVTPPAPSLYPVSQLPSFDPSVDEPSTPDETTNSDDPTASDELASPQDSQPADEPHNGI
jgi:hypothetical protein